MSKKIVAMLMAVAMAFSLLPVTALAVDGTQTPANATQPRTSVTADTEDGVHISKKVEAADDGNYNLVMEAYVEGNTKIVDSSKPLDIVLVLDVSGSMDNWQGWGTTRIASLKSAVKNFIDEVAKKNIAKDGKLVGHRISIVTFASNSQTIKPLTDVGTGVNDLKTAVSKLSTGGATRADLGMQQAKTELNSNLTDQSRGKVVVMFTDGTPTSGNTFENEVASDAISASKALKDKGVKVYTIGIFKNANSSEIKGDWNTWGWEGENKNNKYMQAVSSNYPTASLTVEDRSHSWNPGQRAEGNYYLTATDADGLKNVFQTISNSITTTHVTANASAILRDTLMKQFVLNGDVNAITVKKAKVTGKTGNAYSWGRLEKVDGIKKNVSSDGKTVTVTGFDYTSTGTTGNVITKNGNDYSGYKLIVTIPIKVDEAYEGWQAGPNNYDTNVTNIEDQKAGLTNYKKGEEEASTLLDTSPQVLVTAYKVTYKYDKVYAEAPDLINDTKAYLPGKILSVQPTPNWDGYSFSGWNYPDTIQVNEGKFSMPAQDVEITGFWTENVIHINYVALDGGTITESTETDQKNYSETVGLANPQVKGATAQPDTGKYFVGWYSDRKCTNFVGGQTKLVPTITSQQDSVTYYAKFSDKKTITIKVPDKTLTYTGEELTGKEYSDAETTGLLNGYSIKVTQDNYTPATGTNVSSSESPYAGSFANPQFTISQGDTNVTDQFDVTFIPGKLHINGTVTYDANTNDTTVEGLPTDESTYFLNEEVTTKTETPTRDGYDFVGWMLSEDAQDTVTQGTMGATGLTFYAKWSEKKVDVKLSDLIKKELTVKSGSELPNDTKFTVTVTPTGDQPAITGTTTSEWTAGTQNKDGDTIYTASFNFGPDDTLSLPAGTYTYTVQETEGDVSGMQYDSNKYTLTITVPGNGEASYQAAPITIQNTYQAPDLSVEKKTVSVAGEPVNNNNPVAHVGEQIVWKVRVKNEKSTPARVTLTDAMAEGVYIDNECKTPAENVNWNPTAHSWTATVSGEETYYVNYTVKEADIPKGKIVNTIVMKNGDTEKKDTSDPVSTWDTKQLKSATKLDTSDWTTTVTLTLPTVNGNKEGTPETEVQPDPITAISKGSYVIDKIGKQFTFMDGLSLKKNNAEIPKKKIGDTYYFGENATEQIYLYKLTYTERNGEEAAQFKWEINENIPAETTVTLSYKLKLTTPKTAAGTYGVEDLNGDGIVDGTESTTNTTVVAADALYTNESATMVPKDSDGHTGEELTFPKPSVSYTVSSGNSGSHSGGSRPSLNTKDHYGYIIGYPVDYYTGQPTTDQTKKPVRPEGKITRAEVATIYFRMLTDESRTKFWSQNSGYSDVKAGDWFNNAVSTLSKAGIIAGYEDGSFRPNGYITRAEFATIAARFFDVTYNGKDLFPDISGHWAKDYINQAANKGFVNGYEDGTFKPDRNITRAEAVTLVNRTLDRHPDKNHFTKDMLVWPDNMDQTKWYYADMQEATNSHTYQMKENSDKTKYENWTKTLPIRNWEALEKAWSNANSSQGNGNVV